MTFLQDPTKPGALEFLQRTTQWTTIKQDWELKIKPTAVQNGAKTFGSFGTCWGSYPVIRFSSLPEFVVGVSAHPSHTKISMVLGEQEKELLEKVCHFNYYAVVVISPVSWECW